ncbi:hypothetical protein H7J51_16495 [Mycobacterium crocinum]|uniref:Uncharacterized protein n=1 Tax=Mycolicibacterium crocinum TaxID=388459 RepID=A0ABY3TK60_9MYCO|nr:hypothetical protein [Mycolicibacterium crocinum]MCV7216878.1 hypothetical protein [Mycolicibacterium crocinum]ULN40142.1 hypothetical protein MI149_20965 [Mycolicibacterium crocinum]
MTAERFGVQSAANRAADQSQADHFRAELQRELQAVDQQIEKLQSQLSDHVANQRAMQTYETEGNLTTLAVARRSLVDMLTALAGRFPSDTPQTDPPPAPAAPCLNNHQVSPTPGTRTAP